MKRMLYSSGSGALLWIHIPERVRKQFASTPPLIHSRNWLIRKFRKLYYGFTV